MVQRSACTHAPCGSQRATGVAPWPRPGRGEQEGDRAGVELRGALVEEASQNLFEKVTDGFVLPGLTATEHRHEGDRADCYTKPLTAKSLTFPPESVTSQSNV